jgi:hypothetical protein
MANDATLSRRRRKMFPRSCIRGNFLDSSGKDELNLNLSDQDEI